jgi:hypothetical protein
MIYELIDGVPTQMVEICVNCGKQPLADSGDICFGCGQKTKHHYVPARECIEYGINQPIGIRWRGFGK